LPVEIAKAGDQQEAEKDGMESKDDQALPGRKSSRDPENIQLVNVLVYLQVEQDDEAESGQKLNDEITNGKRRPASPAFAPEHPITDKRNVVVQANGLKAVAASRPRPNETLLQRQPGDADIEKAAYNRAENKHEDQAKNWRQVNDPIWQRKNPPCHRLRNEENSVSSQ
jgi:hypothetical protein